jgi:DNA modification methylase
MNKLICGDVLSVLPTLGRFKCLIADPPDNIGLEYDDCPDMAEASEYRGRLLRWIWAFKCAADISWVSFNAKWFAAVGRIAEDIERCCPDVECRLFVQTFTFGQNRDSDCGNGFRPLLRIRKCKAPIYPDAIKVPSWREQHGDKRARAGGKVPLDVWDFPRVVGNSKQRRDWHPTQLNEGLIERIVKFSTVPGDAICDCFSGTGTVLRAVKDRPVTSIEQSRKYCELIAAEHGLELNLDRSKRWLQYERMAA